MVASDKTCSAVNELSSVDSWIVYVIVWPFGNAVVLSVALAVTNSSSNCAVSGVTPARSMLAELTVVAAPAGNAIAAGESAASLRP
jgi:hypothetical protein